jgi:hypothetical protein
MLDAGAVERQPLRFVLERVEGAWGVSEGQNDVPQPWPGCHGSLK